MNQSNSLAINVTNLFVNCRVRHKYRLITGFLYECLIDSSQPPISTQKDERKAALDTTPFYYPI